MKIARLFAAAGLMLATVAVPAAADAQGYRGDHYGRYDRDYRDHRGYRDGDRHYRGDGRGWRDNGRRYGWNGRRGHQRCWIEHRHRHAVRVCR